MDKMPELLPCPFCPKGETRIKENHHSPTMSGGIKEPISVDIHHWCEGEGLPRRSVTITGRTRAEAIAHYNTRAPKAEQQPHAQGVTEDAISDLNELEIVLRGRGEFILANRVCAVKTALLKSGAVREG